jgi:hypothetical protein
MLEKFGLVLGGRFDGVEIQSRHQLIMGLESL